MALLFEVRASLCLRFDDASVLLTPSLKVLKFAMMSSLLSSLFLRRGNSARKTESKNSNKLHVQYKGRSLESSENPGAPITGFRGGGIPSTFNFWKTVHHVVPT